MQMHLTLLEAAAGYADRAAVYMQMYKNYMGIKEMVKFPLLSVLPKVQNLILITSIELLTLELIDVRETCSSLIFNELL